MPMINQVKADCFSYGYPLLYCTLANRRVFIIQTYNGKVRHRPISIMRFKTVYLYICFSVFELHIFLVFFLIFFLFFVNYRT